MRKLVVALVAVTALALGTAAVAAPETLAGLPLVNVIVNGRALPAPGVVVEGKSMAPVRALAESLGGSVTWDQTTFTATITAPDVTQLQAEITQLKAENAALLAKLQPVAPIRGTVSTQTNPAAVGTTQTQFVKGFPFDYTARVTLLEVIRGDAAWTSLKAANVFNEEPTTGTEYILARFRFELVTIGDDKALAVSPAQFTAISSAGREYEPVHVTTPDPSLRTSLYSGSSHEGWVAFQAAVDDAAPVAAFGRHTDGTGGIWFKLFQ